MISRSRSSVAGLALALMISWLGVAATPAQAETVAPRRGEPVAVTHLTVPGASADGASAQAYGCDVYTFGPMLGAAGVFAEWDIYCDFFTPFLSVGGTLRIGTGIVGSNGANCTGSSFCVLVVQSSGCLSGRTYLGRMDGTIQFPDGQIVPFTFLAPPNGVPVRVC